MTLVATGNALRHTIEVAELLKQKNVHARVLSMHTLKPINRKVILAELGQAAVVATIEEHNVSGGLATTIAEVLAGDAPTGKRLYCFGVDRLSLKREDDPQLVSSFSLNAREIADRIAGILKRRS